MDIQVEGIEDIDLDQVEKNIDRVMEKAAQESVPHAKDNAPVDTGTLEDSIRANKNTVKAHAGYSALVHQGTAYQQAIPFLKDAVNRTDLISANDFTQIIDE